MKQSASHLYQEIAESLRRRIASGELSSGDRLPSVREMAQQWGCTPGTVSRAYSVLADEGLVTGHRGGGTRVCENPLPEERPFLHWATLINRAEQFLLEAMSSGHSPAQAQSALSVAISRWQVLQHTPQPAETAVPHTQLRFSGSHDLTVDLLARHLSEAASAVPLHVTFNGSLGGLMALARREADLAGVHLWDAATDQYNVPFVRRVLPGQRVALVNLVQRSMGLIVPPGNPQGLHSLADLSNTGVILVNRQAGSGTRVWLDAQLAALGVSPSAIAGYEQEMSTHTAVAQAIQDGSATAGLGIFAAAAAYGLDFVPLTQELYQLVIPEDVWETAALQILLAILRSPAFHEAVSALGGYDTTATGIVTWL
ncbi:MAG: GntR family transcriptional regulator [Ardenticatenaceae bacterium]|nr:GntR family transcriptional regulator [Anaerolineales bacterium]MCB8920822.1 GntR family transcriptional regulator [Ardenticatenaceae bacterium]MCB8989781.1 GntR family transcriptional regulator [Ardenticatenaceae bacterium]MCB9002760.1 GntR family transcriptional regulator [Ardenticatenaceae bacterium]